MKKNNKNFMHFSQNMYVQFDKSTNVRSKARIAMEASEQMHRVTQLLLKMNVRGIIELTPCEVG